MHHSPLVKVDPYKVQNEMTGKKSLKQSIVLKPVQPPKKRDASQYSGSDVNEGYVSSGQQIFNSGYISQGGVQSDNESVVRISNIHSQYTSQYHNSANKYATGGVFQIQKVSPSNPIPLRDLSQYESNFKENQMMGLQVEKQGSKIIDKYSERNTSLPEVLNSTQNMSLSYVKKSRGTQRLKPNMQGSKIISTEVGSLIQKNAGVRINIK